MPTIELMVESGVSFKELEDYLKKISLSHEASTFYGGGWKIDLVEQKWVKTGSLTLPRTSMRFSGCETAVLATLKEFRMRFLSAGG